MKRCTRNARGASFYIIAEKIGELFVIPMTIAKPYNYIKNLFQM